MATWLVKGLLVSYIIILIVAIYEKDWKWALYWFGAACLMVSVIWMKG